MFKWFRTIFSLGAPELRKVKFEPKVKPNPNIYPEPSDIFNIYLVYKVPYLHFPLASQVRMILF